EVMDGNVAGNAVGSQQSLVLPIGVVVPLLIALIKMEIPKLPTWCLPLLAPALGALADCVFSLRGRVGRAGSWPGLPARREWDCARSRTRSREWWRSGWPP